ncbi:GIY-YIG nuclease family protein [Hellea balneolensis]|uniref:GIY-YIG nuclease family protein n=1 Tax=Hellea balneolensis TaxID=287478 RepID=UPI000A012111|nr:GIY-YIG nuclease family protein [Hellea balneolensis]
MFYVYIITNKRNGTLYIGQTDDIGARIEQHQNGIHKGFALKYGCTRLVWFEEHPTRDSAFRGERQMKAWRRSWKIELIETANPHWLVISNESLASTARRGLCGLAQRVDGGRKKGRAKSEVNTLTFSFSYHPRESGDPVTPYSQHRLKGLSKPHLSKPSREGHWILPFGRMNGEWGALFIKLELRI